MLYILIVLRKWRKGRRGVGGIVYEGIIRSLTIVGMVIKMIKH
jgi:hypothetical protein